MEHNLPKNRDNVLRNKKQDGILTKTCDLDQTCSF